MTVVRSLIANHPLIGTWRAKDEDYSSIYTVSASNAELEVSAIDQRNNESFLITNVRWAPSLIEFDTEMPSTGRKGHQKIDLSVDQVFLTFTFSDSCELQKIREPKPYFAATAFPVMEHLLGIWRADEDDQRSEYEVGIRSNQIYVTGKDFIDGEEYLISNISSSEKSVSFDSIIPSTNRTAHLEIGSKDGKINLSYRITLRLQAIRS